ncbi:MAG: hypothetical protein M0Z39_08715 [Actinomycetota bacterium]|jgi:hypothetical protein|nr:hypothetical protein [Actinomycetota bacterium]
MDTETSNVLRAPFEPEFIPKLLRETWAHCHLAAEEVHVRIGDGMKSRSSGPLAECAQSQG